MIVKPSEPGKIDVVGMTLAEARSELYDAGWTPEVVDETPYSDYVPGEYENGNTRYAGKLVTRVAYPSSSSASRPVCKVYFESEEQPQLEFVYDIDYSIFSSTYDELLEDLVTNGAYPDLIRGIESFYGHVRDYDDDQIPISRKDMHRQLLRKYEILYETVS